MYLVVEPATQIFVFTEEDPRNDGYEGPLEKGVTLNDSGNLRDADSNATTAVPCVGRSPDDFRHYAVFPSKKECRQSGFQPVATVYAKYKSWNEFAQQ